MAILVLPNTEIVMLPEIVHNICGVPVQSNKCFRTASQSVLQFIQHVLKHDKWPYHTSEALVSISQVWASARNSTIPNWREGENGNDRENIILCFIKWLNQLNNHLSLRFAELIVVELSQICSGGEIINQRIVTHKNNDNLLHISRPITDIELGREFGFFWPNVEHYTQCPFGPRSTFSVEEVKVARGLLLFAEIFYPDRLISSGQLDTFYKHAAKRIVLLNKTMERFDWPFRFNGTISHGPQQMEHPIEISSLVEYYSL